MSKNSDVMTGEIKFGKNSDILQSIAIGSCIVLIAYDIKRKEGAIAHIMLPGNPPKNIPEKKKNRYTDFAIKKLISGMIRRGSGIKDLRTCLAGGGNVLQRDDDAICKSNIESVTSSLTERNIAIKKKAVGGTVRRSVFFKIETGTIYYSEDSKNEKVLYQFKNK